METTSPFHAFQVLDAYLFHLVNYWCGHWFLDHLVQIEENLWILNGSVVVGAYLWLWFEGNDWRRSRQRGHLLAALIGGGAATLFARVLANFLPFRVRPMYAGIGYHASSIPIVSDFEHWSSFPSDHAALYFALAFGVWLLWRGLGWILLLYSAFWICMPRVYLGIHYPSDVFFGALIGIGAALVFKQLADSAFFTRWVKSPVLALERRSPQLFYGVAFLANVELATMFADLRDVAREAKFLLYLSPIKAAIFLLVCAALATTVIVVVRRRLMLISAGDHTVHAAANEQAVIRAQKPAEDERTAEALAAGPSPAARAN